MTLTTLLFLLAFATGCLLAFTRHPIYGLLTYVADFYLHPPSRWWGEVIPGNLRWSLIAAAVTLLAMLVHRDETRRSPVLRHPTVIGLFLFTVWVAVQSLWALNPAEHAELLALFAKYVLLVALIYKCVDSEKHLRLFLWTHVLGCLYLGWLVYTSYEGGRFEDFGGPGIDEANSGALQIVTGIFAASSLFIAGRLSERVALFGSMPFIVNALVATISRSGFLAMGVGGLVYNFFTAQKFRYRVRVLSVLALILFFLLTNPIYWMRIQSLEYAGEEVEGVDTGAGRLTLVEAQWDMFRAHPLGCGHRCTATLSRQYLDDSMLTGEGESRGRSSHNTFMTLLVEQGVPGAVFYLLMMWWTVRNLRILARLHKNDEGFLATLFPAVAAILSSAIIADLFVDYLKLEVRFWFIAILMVLVDMRAIPAESPVLTAGEQSGRPLPEASP